MAALYDAAQQMTGFAALRDRLRRIWPTLDERTRRLVAANEATA